jgi:hypothetical protein
MLGKTDGVKLDELKMLLIALSSLEMSLLEIK